MEIHPLIGLGNLRFSDDLSKIRSKLRPYQIHSSIRSVLGHKQVVLYVDQMDLLIIFVDERATEIEFFEIGKGSVFFEGMNLFKTEYTTLLAYFEKHDGEIVVSEEGFDAPQVGVGAYRKLSDGEYTRYPNSITVFRRDYLKKKMPSIDDMIKHYLKG